MPVQPHRLACHAERLGRPLVGPALHVQPFAQRHPASSALHSAAVYPMFRNNATFTRRRDMTRYNGRNQDVDDHVTLDGYIVRATTDLAVGVAKAKSSLGREEALTWLPRSMCDDGDSLKKDDTDIVVERWNAD